jgi:hypothetical protein
MCSGTVVPSGSRPEPAFAEMKTEIDVFEIDTERLVEGAAD